jgi:formiminotetrahydrofolate cyclodeaminase
LNGQTGVSAAAASATLGLNLLVMVLEIVAKRKNFAGDLEKLKSLCDGARSESERLARYAYEDVAAYAEYMKSRRLTRRLIEVPMQTARSALLGLDLCAEAVGMVSGAVVSDLGTAAILLAGAVRAILLHVDVNLQHQPDPHATVERQELEKRALRQLDSILRQIGAA